MDANNPRKPPTGATRFFARVPIALYRWHLGWVMGGHFLLLNHVGRNSGLTRQVVLEVVRHDQTRDSFVICSGFGEQSQWYRNLISHPEATIQVRNRRLAVQASRLTPDEGAAEMIGYARRHPRAAKKLAAFMGFPSDGLEATYREIGQSMPFIDLAPPAPANSHSVS